MVAPGKLIRVSTAAKYLDVSPQRIYEMFQDGRLTCKRVGKVKGYRVLFQELQRFIDPERKA